MDIIKLISEKYNADEKEVLNVYKFFQRNFGAAAASMTRDYFKKRGES